MFNYIDNNTNILALIYIVYVHCLPITTHSGVGWDANRLRVQIYYISQIISKCTQCTALIINSINMRIDQLFTSCVICPEISSYTLSKLSILKQKQYMQLYYGIICNNLQKIIYNSFTQLFNIVYTHVCVHICVYFCP